MADSLYPEGNMYDLPPPSFEDTIPLVPCQGEEKMNQLRALANKYELAGGAVAKLRKLERYDIVIIADDSSSMGNPAHNVQSHDPFARIPTRWEELRERIVQVVEIATCLDSDGIDIYFLNRYPAFNVTNIESAKFLFSNAPNGYTPLSACYMRVLEEKVKVGEKPVLIIIATDGEPNRLLSNGHWTSDVEGFKALLKNRNGLDPKRCPTTIMACTDSEWEIGWINNLDDEVPNLDVVDDYSAERLEILAKQGQNFHFSMGDYIVKTMIGSIDPIYDQLDEKRLTHKQREEYMGQTLPSISGVQCIDQCPCIIS